MLYSLESISQLIYDKFVEIIVWCLIYERMAKLYRKALVTFRKKFYESTEDESIPPTNLNT
jgi:hypothetical protein